MAKQARIPERPRCRQNATVPLHDYHHHRHGILHRRLRSLLHLFGHQTPRPHLLPRRRLSKLRHTTSNRIRRRQRRGLLWHTLWPALLRLARRQDGTEEGLRYDPHAHGHLLLSIWPFIRPYGQKRHGYPLFLPLLARLRHRRRLPLSATIMSEYANKMTCGAFIVVVFAMQGFGILAGGIVTLIVSSAFKNHFKAPPYNVDPIDFTVPEADYVWRIILMFGAIPAVVTYCWRMKMPETARYTELVAKNAKQAAQDMAKVLQMEIHEEQEKVDSITLKESNQFGLFSREFLRPHGLHLVGTTTTWFVLDIAFYSQNLFQKDIFSAIGWIPKAATMNALEEVFKISRAQTLIVLCGTVPGYWFTVALIDIIGRFVIQMLGFFFMLVFMLDLAIPCHHWTTPGNHIGFVVMYGLTFVNFGLNSTTFIVPAEIFLARLRSTCHGISAAAGKARAIVGSFGFLYAAQNNGKTKTDCRYPPGIGVRNSLFVLAACNLLGLLFTFLVPESKGKSLEEMSGENEEEETQENVGSSTVPV